VKNAPDDTLTNTSSIGEFEFESTTLPVMVIDCDTTLKKLQNTKNKTKTICFIMMLKEKKEFFYRRVVQIYKNSKENFYI
jgi:hypothetical protein